MQFVWQLLLCFTKISKNKIPSSQAKDGLTYDEISGEIDDSSAFSIIYILAKVKILIWMKIQLGLEKIMIDVILKYTKKRRSLVHLRFLKLNQYILRKSNP